MRPWPSDRTKRVSTRTRTRPTRLALIAGVFSAVLSCAGCGFVGTNTSVSYIKECSIPSDQSGTINGQWSKAPIPIAFQAGAFSKTEMDAIVEAATTWNSFFGASKNVRILDFGDATNPRTSANPKLDPDSMCSQTMIPASDYVAPLVIYKSSTWPTYFDSRAIAVTKFCYRSGTPYRKFFMSWIDINFQYFFASGKKLPDLQTILLHELGHVVGLDHSCEGGGRTGMPDCNNNSLPAAYKEASMYPVFGFDASGFGQQKRELKDNDQSRANCLY